ncbi:MAG TPA: acetyl-CoA carboxylase [Streptosporangiaceae bacterium]|jgi:biotin carboxyl carrier protein|nr:acetyl-CoA carboxylase [Streptosporangiaceae bacterium]
MTQIVSPLPGVFYTKPGPDKDPFVLPGDRVEAGQAIGMVEVMKQFTEIRSDVSGTVVSVDVAEGDTVMPGDVLAVIDED